jgi:hypothetical protein
MVRAQRRSVKNTKPSHLDHEFSVAELIQLGTKKRKPSLQALAALQKYREKKRSGIARMGQTPTQILETGLWLVEIGKRHQFGEKGPSENREIQLTSTG